MKHYYRLLCLILPLCLLLGCVPAQDIPTSTDETTQTEPEETSEEERLYSQLFSLDCQIKLELDMSDEELAKLQADYGKYSSRGSKSPIYRMADLTVHITDETGVTSSYVIEQVGVRMKGNTSRTSFYDTEDGIYNLIHLKLSFQETFDDETYYGKDALKWDEASRKERKNRTFATLEKLDLRWNKCNDATYIREYYAYEMFRANGVAAPRTNLASVDWATLHMGVFTICEPVDKLFIRRNFPEEQQGGDLYKCGWTSEGATFTNTNSIGIEDEDEGKFYVYDLKTNKKTSQHERLVALIRNLNQGLLTKEAFSSLVDVENLLNFSAVSYLLGNPDDARNNYNNFYIYFPPNGGCVLIPYDYDRCLGLTYEWDPTGNGMTTDDPFSLTIAANGSQQQNPLFLYSVCQGGYYVSEYAQRLQQIAASQWMDEVYYTTVFGKAQKQYGRYTNPSKTFHNGSGHSFTMTLESAGGNLTFRQYSETKQKNLSQYLQNVDTSAKPNVSSDYYIRGEFTGWEVQSGYEMQLQKNGSYTYLLPGGKWKVYSRSREQWFGSEVLDEHTGLQWETDDHTNIILPEGRYLLTFNPQTDTILITEAP